ncbi:MAG: diacylglycerol/polyprenol kinase family protein [Devosia sp.]
MSLTPTDGIIIAVILLAIPALMLAVRLLGQRFGWNPEVSRKLIHVGTGSLALTFPLLFSNPLPVLVLLGLAIPLMFAIRLGVLGGLGNVLHAVQRQSYGEVYLALAIAITFLRAEEQPVLYVLPILVITLSDTAAALIGTAYGRQRFRVEGGAKSVEGVVVFFFITWLASLIVLVLMSGAAPLNMVLISMLLAAFCALVEVDSWRGLDNLFVPIGAFLLLARYLDSGPEDLAASAAIFLAFLAAVLVLAHLLRLPQQAARAYAILLFLILSIVSLHNVILPTLAIAAHLAARTVRPCHSKRADFDLLFVAALSSLLWMFIGDAGDRSVISLFNLTFVGAALGFLMLALTGPWRLLVIPAFVVAAGLELWVAETNLPWSRSFLPNALEVALALLVAVALPLWRPEWFDKQRSLRIFALAMIGPLFLCLRGLLLP